MSSGCVEDEEVLFLSSRETGSALYGFSPTLAAIERVTGTIVKEVFNPATAAELRPAYGDYSVLGVDSRGRVYLEFPGAWLLIVSRGEVIYENESKYLVNLAIQTQAGDELLAGTTKYSLFRLQVLEDGKGFSVWVTSIPSVAPLDTRQCVFSVSPDGRFMYVGTHTEAWVWDDHGHLSSVIAFGFQPWRLRDIGVDPEAFRQLAFRELRNVFVGFAPTGYFDRENRLFLFKDGKFWVYDAEGRRLSYWAGFELTGPDGEVVSPRKRWIFAPSDNHMFVINDLDDMIYEFDVSPVFEKVQDENSGLWYPGDKLPLFIRRFKPELPAMEEGPEA